MLLYLSELKGFAGMMQCEASTSRPFEGQARVNRSSGMPMLHAPTFPCGPFRALRNHRNFTDSFRSSISRSCRAGVFLSVRHFLSFPTGWNLSEEHVQYFDWCLLKHACSSTKFGVPRKFQLDLASGGQPNVKGLQALFQDIQSTSAVCAINRALGSCGKP